MKKHLIFLTFIFIIISNFSCQKFDLSNLSDVIYVRNNGADMPAYIYGNGSEKVFIIILHGGPGGNGLEYRTGTAMEELEKHYAMVYWDQRGQGLSQGKYDSTHVTIDQMVEDLHALVLILKYKYGNDINLFLLGHSWGGTLGTAYMLKDDYQNELKGWIEADGAHDIPLLNKEALKMFIEIAEQQISVANSTDDWQAILDWASQIDTNNISIEQGGEINSNGHSAENYLYYDGIIAEGDIDFTIRDMLIFYHQNFFTSSISGAYTTNYLYNEVETTSYTAQLETITTPCLFLWGKYDFVVPTQLGYDAYNKVNTTEKEIIIFEYSGHSPMVNEPDKFAKVIIDFVEKYK